MKKFSKLLAAFVAVIVAGSLFVACTFAAVDSVVLDITSETLKIGETITITATVEAPEETTDRTVRWSSSKSSVASVDSDGKVTAKAAGTATITATSKANSLVKATCEITVTDPNAFTVYKNAGTYKVGTEIIAGEYLLITDTQNEEFLSSGYYEVTRTPNAAIGTDDYLYNDNFYYRSYISVADGEYLKFSGCKLVKIADYPAVDKGAASWHSGQYKVGVDLDAGEYKLTVLAGETSGYFETTRTPNGKIGTDDFIDNDFFSNQTYIALDADTYINFSSSVLTKV